MLDEITPIINLHASGRSYGSASVTYKYDGQRFIEFNLTLKKFKVGMTISSDLWILFSNLQKEFKFEQIAEIHITDGTKTTVMHCNYFLMCDTKICDRGLDIDDYILDIELLNIRLYESDSA